MTIFLWATLSVLIVTSSQNCLASDSSVPSSVTTAPDKVEQESPVQPEAVSEKVANDSDDGRIKKLEQQVLGKTYEGDSTSRRVDRLEKAEFGSPSNTTNLGDRLTLLEAYAGKPNLSKERTHSEWSEEEAPQSDTSVGEAPQTDTAVGEAPSMLSTKNPEVGNLVRRVAAMEKVLFGRSYPDKPLLSRIQRLEKEVGVDNQKTAQEDLPTQVDDLWAQVGPSNSDQAGLGNKRKYKTRMASSLGENADLYSFGTADGSISLGDGNWGDGQTQPTVVHQSLLQKLGRMFGGAFTGNALESPYFDPYGYGGMYPYSPYGSYMNPTLTPGWGYGGGYGGYYPHLGGGYWGGSPWGWGGSPWGGGNLLNGNPWGGGGNLWNGNPWGGGGNPWGGSPWRGFARTR